MKVSSKSRYGIKALLDLAVQPQSELIALKTVAERQNISERYLEQVFSLLKKAGYLKSVKGPQGGYQIDVALDQLTLYEVIKALEGEQGYQVLVEEDDLAEKCLQEQLWQPLDQLVYAYLQGKTIADLVEDYQTKRQPASYMFFI